MPESLGARLRQRREEQQVALTTIAEQTKIKLSLLQALERDDVSCWPSGIFRRAYIRAYAEAIGLAPDAILREFLQVHPDPDEVIETAETIAAAVERARAPGGPPTRLRNMVGSAIESISRLRRSSTGDSLTVAEGRPANGHAVSEPDPPMAGDGPPAAAMVDRPIETADHRRTSETPAPDPDSPDAPSLSDETRAADLPMSLAEESPAGEPPAPGPDWLALASLCTEFGRAGNADALQSLLPEAARILDATGLIVWMWDASTGELRPALAHGYSDQVIAHLPRVRPDADNVTAAAFQLTATCEVEGRGDQCGALAVPLLTPTGCSGVLALELRNGGERTTAVRAVATILAAVLSQLTGDAPVEDFGPLSDMRVPNAGDITRPLRVSMRANGPVRVSVRSSTADAPASVHPPRSPLMTSAHAVASGSPFRRGPALS